MAKRSSVKIESKESMALKKIREMSGLSQKEAARKIGVSASAINHRENGRAEIDAQYMTQFLRGMECPVQTWKNLVAGRDPKEELIKECENILGRLTIEKVKIIRELLVRF